MVAEPKKMNRFEGMTPEELEAIFMAADMSDPHELQSPRGVAGKEKIDW